MNLELLGPIVGPILLIMATLASSVLVALRILEKKTEKKNGGFTAQKIEHKPGHAKACLDNKTDITELKVTGKFVAKEISEIKTTMGKIWGKLDGA